jgi:hypothetical protein
VPHAEFFGRCLTITPEAERKHEQIYPFSVGTKTDARQYQLGKPRTSKKAGVRIPGGIPGRGPLGEMGRPGLHPPHLHDAPRARLAGRPHRPLTCAYNSKKGPPRVKNWRSAGPAKGAAGRDLTSPHERGRGTARESGGEAIAGRGVAAGGRVRARGGGGGGTRGGVSRRATQVKERGRRRGQASEKILIRNGWSLRFWRVLAPAARLDPRRGAATRSLNQWGHAP